MPRQRINQAMSRIADKLRIIGRGNSAPSCLEFGMGEHGPIA
jgi:hypothetical protein